MHDVTLSGGEPFEQPEACAALAAELKQRGYGLWSFTGYLYEDLARRAENARDELARRKAASSLGADAQSGPEATSEGEPSGPMAAGGIDDVPSDLCRDLAIGTLLDHLDVLVDGPFVEKLKSLELKWCGSSNQRLIDMPATRRTGRIVLWQPESFSLEKPSNW